MKIKPGMFVRTKHRNEVVIRQIKNIFETSEHDHQLVFDKSTRYQYYVEDNNFIAKEKLIELIEIGDFIEYKQSNMHWNIPTRVTGRYNRQQELTELMVGEISLKYVEITSIVTKEQFEREKYVIGE